MASYDGPVVFREGVHYATDADGHADLERPLRWEDGGYRDAIDGEPLHNDVHHAREATVDPATLMVHAPGGTVYPIGTHVVSEDAENYFVADEHGVPLDDVPLKWDAATQTFRKDG